MKNSALSYIRRQFKRISSNNITYKYLGRDMAVCTIKSNKKIIKISYFSFEFNTVKLITSDKNKHTREWLEYCNYVYKKVNLTPLLFSANLLFSSNGVGEITQFRIGSTKYKPGGAKASPYIELNNTSLNDTCFDLLRQYDSIPDKSVMNNLVSLGSGSLFMPVRQDTTVYYGHICVHAIHNNLYTWMKRDSIADIITSNLDTIKTLNRIASNTSINRFIVEFNKVYKKDCLSLSIQDSRFHIDFTTKSGDIYVPSVFGDACFDRKVTSFYGRKSRDIAQDPSFVSLCKDLCTIIMCTKLSNSISTENTQIIVRSLEERYTIYDITVNDLTGKLTITLGQLLYSAFEAVPSNIGYIADTNILDVSKYLSRGVSNQSIESGSFCHEGNLYKVYIYTSAHNSKKLSLSTLIKVLVNGKNTKITKSIIDLCKTFDLI